MHLDHGGICLHGIWLMQTLFIVSYAIASAIYGLFVRRVPMETKHHLRIWAIFCVIFFGLTYATMLDRTNDAPKDHTSGIGEQTVRDVSGQSPIRD